MTSKFCMIPMCVCGSTSAEIPSFLPTSFQGPSQKDPTKPRIRAKSTKELSEQFEGDTGHHPLKNRVLRQIAPESSPERSAKPLSHSFFVRRRANREVQNRELRRWLKRGCRAGCQEQPEKGA